MLGAASQWKGIRKGMKKYRLIVVLLLLASVVPFCKAQTTHLSAIEIKNFDPSVPITPREYKFLAKGVITDELDLGEDIENQLIILHLTPGATRELRVEQRFETSITIMDEGPHLDLIDWKHYYSPWREIKRLGENRFLTLKTDESESGRFPKVTAAEIKQAILKAGGKEWAKLVRRIKGPNDYPSGVGVSKISFRIAVKENERWQAVMLLHFKIPMGC
jgi:hypothetical protein